MVDYTHGIVVWTSGTISPGSMVVAWVTKSAIMDYHMFSLLHTGDVKA